MTKKETYAEYLWREPVRKSGGEMDKTTTDQIPCDTEDTEERKFSDLEPEVAQPDISASAASDVLPEFGCRHVQARLLKVFCGYQFIANEFCPKCGEKL